MSDEFETVLEDDSSYIVILNFYLSLFKVY
jgi:hypothetical protein